MTSGLKLKLICSIIFGVYMRANQVKKKQQKHDIIIVILINMKGLI